MLISNAERGLVFSDRVPVVLLEDKVANAVQVGDKGGWWVATKSDEGQSMWLVARTENLDGSAPVVGDDGREYYLLAAISRDYGGVIVVHPASEPAEGDFDQFVQQFVNSHRFVGNGREA